VGLSVERIAAVEDMGFVMRSDSFQESWKICRYHMTTSPVLSAESLSPSTGVNETYQRKVKTYARSFGILALRKHLSKVEGKHANGKYLLVVHVIYGRFI
jgi:hypothetical protein